MNRGRLEIRWQEYCFEREDKINPYREEINNEKESYSKMRTRRKKKESQSQLPIVSTQNKYCANWAYSTQCTTARVSHTPALLLL